MEAEVCQVAPSAWTRRSIEDVCERVTSGGTPSRRNREFFHNGTWAWVKSQELQDRWIDDTEEKITNEAIASSSAKILPPNTVLLALYGATVGQLGILRREMTCNQACCAMIVDPKQADFRYLFYQLIAARPFLKRLATGAAQQNLSGQLIRSMQLPFPPLKEQQAIAYILGTLDDKIELNRRMNQTLEAMARAIFKSWFVDFDPVRAKAAGQQPPGLAPHIAELFPNSFEYSEMGEIPSGWAVGTLANFAMLNPESWSRRTVPEQIEYVELSTTKWGRIESTAKYLWKDAPSRAQRVLRPGDTIVGTVRPGNGSYALITEEGLTGSTGFAVLRPRRPEFQEFIYLAATAAENIKRLAHLADGGAYPAVRPEIVAATEVVWPTDPVIERFSKAVEPLISKIAANVRQSRTLAALRDILLPKLISGEVSVENAEEFVRKRGR